MSSFMALVASYARHLGGV